MAKVVKPAVAGRCVFLIFLLLFSVPNVVDAESGGGVLFFLRSLEETVEKKTLWFYRFFGSSLHPSKLNLAKDCDYDDPNKIQFCPPALNPMIYRSQNFLSPEKSLPSKCIEDPDDPECRYLRELQITKQARKTSRPAPSPKSSQRPNGAPITFVTDFPVGSLATDAPTKDMCYGNMAKNPKFCNS
jgi:hypothetical protein